MNNNRGVALICIGVFLICCSLGLHTYNIYIDKQAGIKSEKVYNQIQEVLLKVDSESINEGT